MITGVQATGESFKPVELEPGLNVVLAERTADSAAPRRERRKSYNGSGKTLLLEIIHFCLGSDAARSPVVDEHLADWTFSIELHLPLGRVTASRSVANPGRVEVTGEIEAWPTAPHHDYETGRRYFLIDEWTAVLGALFYGLALSGDDETRFRPNFRNLFSFAARRGTVAYADPFKWLQVLAAWRKHVANAYFLGLDWSLYQRAEAARKRIEELKKSSASIAAAMALGEGEDFTGIGDLEARRINLDRELRAIEQQLSSFQVSSQYHEYEKRASELTALIHALIEAGVADRETLTFYAQTIDAEAEAKPQEVDAMYREAGLTFPDQVARRLEDAHAFHDQLVENRRHFLSEEMARLRERIRDRDEDVDRRTAERASVLSFLETHGALEEFNDLQRRRADESERFGQLTGQIDLLRSNDEQLTATRIEQQELRRNAREDLDGRRSLWGRVVELFGEFSAEMYELPGQLIVDVANNGGLSLNVDIERSGSQGVTEMVVFCYDMAVACAMAERGEGPAFLAHDSTIFDGVDPRQKATALRIAARQAQAHEFRYLICLNTGDVPWDDLEGFDLMPFVRRQLNDIGDGGLLGIRY